MRKSILKEQIKQKDNTYQSAEAIIKKILDKIINLSVKQSFSNKINSELGNYCFNYMKDNITNMFELNYITYTKESINTKNIINDNNNKSELLFKRKKPDNNTWIEILEPNNLGPDRCEGINVNYRELPYNEDEQNTSNKSIKNNQNKKNKKPKKIKSNFSLHNSININSPDQKSNKNLVLFDIKENNKNITIPNNSNNVNNIISTNIKPNNNNIIQKENNTSQNKNIDNKKSDKISSSIKKKEIIEFSCEDIPDSSQEPSMYDLPNVEFLRREYEESLVKKEEEKIKQKIDEEKEKKQMKLLNDKKNKKLLDSNKLTFDPNGKIISFRQYNTDNLKDFIIPKNFIKEPKRPNANNSNSTQKKTKNINNNNIPINSKTPRKSIKFKEEIIIKNEIAPYHPIKININKSNEKVIPSGSNYQIMSPEIGVTIRENGQSKEGSKEFNKYFKKYSLQDYDEMLNEHLPKINRTFLKTNMVSMETPSPRKSIRKSIFNLNITNKSNTVKRKSKDLTQNNIINKSEDISSYNPLMTSQNNENTLLEKDINNTFNYKMTDSPIKNNMLSSRRTVLNNNNPLLSSIYTNNMNSSNLYTTNIDKFITMKKSGISSLKLELDSLKDLTENNDGLYNNVLTARNNDFIGEKFRIKNHSILNKKNHYINYFGDFNKKIMTNKRWGNELTERYNNKVSTVYSKHQTKLQILRELGNNILIGNKIKLPRNRKVNLITSNNY